MKKPKLKKNKTAVCDRKVSD